MLVAHNPYQRKVLINADSSQAEARVVARMCSAIQGKLSRMDEIFLSGKKIHVVVASEIYNLPESQIPKDNNPGSMYYTAKRTVHANNYDMGIAKFAVIIKQSLLEAKRLQGIYHSKMPEVRGVFHQWVQDQLRKGATIINAYGRPHTFLDRVDNELFRRGYAYYPQSTVADLIELAFQDLDNAAKPEWELDLLLTTHDSITFQMLAEPELIWDACCLLKTYMEAPLNILGLELTIPTEFTLGRDYHRQHKFTSPSSIQHLLKKLGYIYAETPGLHQSLHGPHSGSGKPGGLPLLDSSGHNGSSDPYERLFGPWLL